MVATRSFPIRFSISALRFAALTLLVYHVHHVWSFTLLATYSFASCFSDGRLTFAAKTTLFWLRNFRRSHHTAPFARPVLVDAVIDLGVGLVSFVDFSIGVAFVAFVEFWVQFIS